MLRKLLLSVFAFALLAAAAWARTTDGGKPTKDVFDADLVGGGTYNWVKDTVYVLRNFVFLESGGTLNIQAGTIVKGDQGTQANAKALIISRGARINATGTKADPVIFTSILDSVDSQTDLLVDDRGLWGGLIVLGNAGISDGKRQEAIEGIPLVAGLPDPRALYGAIINPPDTAFNDDDNSGTLRYISIRHGGSVLEANNEINGLTLGGVGRGTVIDHIEVFGNADDGFEFFGGVPDIKYAVTSYGDDDGFDTDEGYRGRIQFGFRLISNLVGNNGTENDGAENPITTTPFTNYNWYNMTHIGSGVDDPGIASNDRGFHFRDNCEPRIRNSIFTQFDELVGTLENVQSIDTARLKITDNIWWGFGCDTGLIANDALTTDSAVCIIQGGTVAQYFRSYILNNNNDEVDPLLTAIGRPHVYNARVLDPRPQPGSPANTGYPDPSLDDPFFTSVTYAGAFSNDSTTEAGTWLCGWTALAQYGFLTTLRGDLNYDYGFTPSDVVTELNVVFLGASASLCVADSNCDGALTPADAVNVINLIFLGIPLSCV